MDFLGYVGALVMGVSLGLLGGGGSILSVPIFVYLFKVPPALATAYSLFVVGLTALLGFWQSWKAKQVDLPTGLLFAGPSFVGVFLVRKFLMPALPADLFQLGTVLVTKDLLIMVVFAILMVMASVSMIKKPKRQMDKPTKVALSPKARGAVIGLEGLFVGAITGFVGAGGGFMIIPALVVLTGLSMKIAVGTSLGIIAVKSLFGFSGDLMNNSATMDWTLLGVFSAVSLVGLVLGRKLNHRVPEEKLKPLFGYFTLMMGLFILIQQVF